jgi:hypothetical protein
MPHLFSGLGSAGLTGAKEVVRVKNGVDDGGVLFQASAHGRRNGLPDFSAQPGAFCQLDAETAHRTYFARTWRNLEDNAELGLHPFFDVSQLGITGDVFNTDDQLFLFLSRQAQDAEIAIRIIQQTVTITHAGTRRALVANWKREGLHHRDYAAIELLKQEGILPRSPYFTPS